MDNQLTKISYRFRRLATDILWEATNHQSWWLVYNFTTNVVARETDRLRWAIQSGGNCARAQLPEGEAW